DLVATKHDGWIQGVIEKAGQDEVTCNTINAGSYVLEPSVLGYIPKADSYSCGRGLFPTLLERKEAVLSFILDQYWIDIGTPQKYLEVHQDILSQKFVSPRVSASGFDRNLLPGTAAVDEKSIIDSGVTIRDGVRIENSVIGKNCKIDEGGQIVDSVIWSGNTIDAGARGSQSIVGKVWYI